MKHVVVAIAGAMSMLASNFCQAESLSLSCEGTGSRPAAASTTGFAYSNGQMATVTGTTYYEVQSTDRVTVEIAGDSGRIRVPLTMIPLVQGGGQDGWWKLDHLLVSDTEITGSFSLNFLNKPRVRIDRRDGSISIHGLSHSFQGECEKFDPDAASRKF